MSNISRVLKLSIFLLLEADDEMKLWLVIQQDEWCDFVKNNRDQKKMFISSFFSKHILLDKNVYL